LQHDDDDDDSGLGGLGGEEPPICSPNVGRATPPIHAADDNRTRERLVVFDQPFVSAPMEDGESSRAFRLPPRSLPNMNTQQSTNCKSNGPAPALFALEVSQFVPSQSGEWPVRLDGLILTVFILHLSLASSNPNFDNSFASSPRRLRRTTTSHSEESDYLYTSPTFDDGARSKVTRRR
jgi:hypothetical protein